MKNKKGSDIPRHLLKRMLSIVFSSILLLGLLPLSGPQVYGDSDYEREGQFSVNITSDFTGFNLDGIDETVAEEWKWGDFTQQPYWKNDPDHPGKMIPGTDLDYNLKYESDTLYLKGANLVVSVFEDGNAIYADQDLAIEIEDGESTITCINGIPLMTEGNLTFTGSGNLTITAQCAKSQCAILANNSVTHNGTGTITVNATGGACGIFWIDENGGTINGSGSWAGTALEWSPDDFDSASRRIYTDGEDHIGYSGCFMTGEEYENSCPFWSGDPAWCYDNPLVWVHGRTIQEVIDKLSGKTPVTLYDAEGNVSGTIEQFKTDYAFIAVSVSNYVAEQIKAEEEYVTSTRDFSGICIRGGYDNQMTNHDKTGTIVVEDAVYRLTAEWVDILQCLKTNYDLSTSIDFTSKFPHSGYGDIPAYISLYKGDLYVAEARTPDNEHPYAYDLGERIASLSEVNAAVQKYNAGSIKVNIEGEDIEEISVSGMPDFPALIADYLKVPIHLPFSTLHINSSCDFRIAGEFSEIQDPKNPDGINIYFGYLPDTDHSLTIVQDDEKPVLTYTKKDIDSLRGVIEADLWYDNGTTEGATNPVKVLLYQHITDGTVSGEYAHSVTMNDESIPDAKLLANVDITEEQLEVLEAGGAVDIDLSVDQMDTTAADNKAAVSDIEAALEGTVYQAPFYMNLDLSASIRNEKGGMINFADGKDQLSLTELNEPVELTVVVPESLKTQKGNREYAVIRRHMNTAGGVVTELLPVTYNPSAGTLTFDTDQFSAYAIVYKEVNTGSTSDIGSTEADSTEAPAAALNGTPETGDTRPLIWIGGMACISFGLGLAAIYRKRRY